MWRSVFKCGQKTGSSGRHIKDFNFIKRLWFWAKIFREFHQFYPEELKFIFKKKYLMQRRKCATEIPSAPIFLMFDNWIALLYSKNGMNRIFYSTFNSSIWTRPLVCRLFLNGRCMQSPWYIPRWIHPTVRVQDILFNPSVCLFSAPSNWINNILIVSDFFANILFLEKIRIFVKTLWRQRKGKISPLPHRTQLDRQRIACK